MKRCSGVNKCKSTVFFALDWSLWVVRDLSCYLVHHLMILPRTDPLGPTGSGLGHGWVVGWGYPHITQGGTTTVNTGVNLVYLGY
jgi:hypothetical protein